jgi:hypothetical protein
MDCLRSFTIWINQSKSFNVAGVTVKTWGTLGNYHWSVIDQQGMSTYQIQGFKNVDLYGMKMLGDVQTDLTSSDGAIVSDFSFRLGIAGQIPLISGDVLTSPNYWGISQTVPQWDLSKYRYEVNFETPYYSTKSITFEAFRAQGNNAETLNSVQLDLNLQFVFYYKYEGE